MLAEVANIGRFIASHPLTRDRKLAAFGRYARWQIQSRLRDDVVVPWIAGTRLLVKRGMAGATGNIYCGLHEFAEMGFVLHLLGPSDVFADVGANVGSYTVLAAGVRGAQVVAVEPSSSARSALANNVNLNGLNDLVRIEGVALGAAPGTLAFTTGLDTINHVVAESEIPHEEVHQTTTDALFSDICPLLIKLDVEGYEAAVLAGAGSTLMNPTLKALIVELNGSGRRYGFDDEQTHQSLLDLGFLPRGYAPLTREIGSQRAVTGDNTIYVRDLDWVRERVESTQKVRILNKEV